MLNNSGFFFVEFIHDGAGGGDGDGGGFVGWFICRREP
jgi:hypothetical protein